MKQALMFIAMLCCLVSIVDAGMARLGIDNASSYSDAIIYCSSTEGTVRILEVWKDTPEGIRTNDARLLQYACRWIPHQPHKGFVLFLKSHSRDTTGNDSPFGIVDVVPIVGDKAKFRGPPIGKHFSTGKAMPIDYDFGAFRNSVRQFSSQSPSNTPNKAVEQTRLTPCRSP